jgi:hypothetical protein
MNPFRWLTSLLRTHQQNPPAPTESFYDLDHALLNITLPPPSMWMNLGYWKVRIPPSVPLILLPSTYPAPHNQRPRATQQNSY